MSNSDAVTRATSLRNALANDFIAQETIFNSSEGEAKASAELKMMLSVACVKALQYVITGKM